jgi:hypothetical protein
LSTHSPADLQAATARLIDLIMDIESPGWRVYDSMRTAAKNNPQLMAGMFSVASFQKTADQRAALQAMTVEDLQLRHASAKAEKARKEEAARFYNLPKAMANYAYWLSLDFWTQDEAVALLLGRNPEVVTWNAVNDLLHPPKKVFGRAPVSTPFLQLFERLRHAAQRSEVMTASPNLKPRAVAQWGQRMLGAKLPKQLQALLDAPVTAAPAIADTQQQPTAGTMDKPPSEPVLVRRKALTAMVNVWPTVESDLRHAGENGLQAAAKASQHGMWKEKEALEWARQNAKRTDTAPAPNTPAYRSSVFHQTK